MLTEEEIKKTDLYGDLVAAAGEDSVRVNEPLSLHTTFRIGGPADIFVYVKDTAVMLSLLRLLRQAGEDFFILGNGSNLLVSDEGFRGVILCTAKGMREARVDVSSSVMTVGAGMMLSEAVTLARANSLDGLSFASGIPGTVGGALVMNAGAFGSEMKDVVTEAYAIDLDTEFPTEIKLDAPALDFHYRGSIAERRHLVFTGAKMRLFPGDQAAITARMEELAASRREKQPLEYPSAGSTFKRPEGYFAGKLIMEAGLKGYSIGGAQVAEKHCGFVVNRGGATADDVYRLMREIEERVFEDSGVRLSPEILFLGAFGD